MFYDIVKVVPLADYRLQLTFEDGSAGEFDFRSRVAFKGVFERLSDENEFREVRVNPEIGTIEWPGYIDLDPVVLYSTVTGKSIDEVLATTVSR